MSEIKHTDPSKVHGIVRDLNPPLCPTASGYGGKLPTSYRVRYELPTGKRWLRVYVVNWGNAGSVYLSIGGRKHFLDIDTEYAIQDGLNSESLVNL